MATTTAPLEAPPVEASLAELLDHLGIASAHFAGRSLADLQGLISSHPERIASLTSSRRPSLIAFRLCGRLRVMTPVAPRLSSRIVS